MLTFNVAAGARNSIDRNKTLQMNSGMAKANWSDEEKQKLVKLTLKHLNSVKQVQWDKVTAEFPGRTKSSLKTLFNNQIKPSLNKDDYKQNSSNHEDDVLLCSLVAQMGHKWNRIQQVIGRQTASQLKLRYFYLQKLESKDTPPCVQNKPAPTTEPEGPLPAADDAELMQKIRQILNMDDAQTDDAV